MSEVQLWLFDPPRPLRDRFGPKFFRELPTCPGVYVMWGESRARGTEEVLYVGKSINLRRRIGSYNGVRPGRASRKSVRLVHSVRRIAWETCADEAAALLRENHLIRSLRPRFNRANTWPLGYWFIGFRSGAAATVELCLQHECCEGWEWFGAFRGSRGFGALLRCLARVGAGSDSARWCSTSWLGPRTPRYLEWEEPLSTEAGGGNSWSVATREFLDGRSSGLLERFSKLGEGIPQGAGFERRVLESDLELLRTFWRMGPNRNRLMAERLGKDRAWIAREELDDLMVAHAPSSPAGQADRA